MQVIDTVTNKTVQYEPGRAVETDFVQDCVDRILAKGVGFMRTEAHVEQDIRDGIAEAIFALKSKVKP
jgi:hypothetical protein